MVQYSFDPGQSFAALSDATRRGILEHLGRGEATISGLAGAFGMTLSGIKKHVRILEEVGLVETVKIGRERRCRLGSRRLDDEIAWMLHHQEALLQRLDHLDAFLDRSKGDPP